MIEECYELEKVTEQSKGYREESTSKIFIIIDSRTIYTPNKRKYYFVAKTIHDNILGCSI